MKKTILFVVFYCFVSNLSAQYPRILCFDRLSQTVDTIDVLAFDASITSAYTPHYIGKLDEKTTILPQSPPVNNLAGNYPVTKVEKFTDIDSIHHYPARTTVRIAQLRNQDFRTTCSGTMVSNKHILTIGYCGLRFNAQEGIRGLRDSIFVFPAYDQGNYNDNFHCSIVNKIYVFENASMGNNDLILLELDEPLGQISGWVGIGFEEDIDIMEEYIFHQFSYPERNSIPGNNIDSRSFDGEDMYYKYGKISPSNIEAYRLGIPPFYGEGGASLTHIINSEKYASYGALYSMSHGKFVNYTYFGFKQILEDHFDTDRNNILDDFEAKIFPNPTLGISTINLDTPCLSVNASLFTPIGQLVFHQTYNTSDGSRFDLDISSLPAGNYILKLSLPSGTEKNYKLVKATE